MARTPSPPQPSRWTRTLNGDRDYIPGFDDGEPQREYRSAERGEPATGDLALETAEYEADNG